MLTHNLKYGSRSFSLFGTISLRLRKDWVNLCVSSSIVCLWSEFLSEENYTKATLFCKIEQRGVHSCFCF